jgi:16S rRNA (guanine527-N7)-methyltransferase
MSKFIRQYFPHLTSGQYDRFAVMEDLYREWNERINVISRRDIREIAVHHILHSLAIAKVISFVPGTTVMDAGTGGGFPGVPLAVFFPEVRFTLVDSIGKKTRVIEAISKSLGLSNISVINARFESVRDRFDFITGRAVSGLPVFFSLAGKAVKKNGMNSIPNGILYLTGGDLGEDLGQVGAASMVYDIRDFFGEDYFSTKKLVHLYNF